MNSPRTAAAARLRAFGRAPADEHRLATVLLMLGKPFWEAAAAHAGLAVDQRDETLASNFRRPARQRAVSVAGTTLLQNADADALPAKLREGVGARLAFAAIDASHELPALLAGLRGDYLPTSSVVIQSATQMPIRPAICYS